MDSSHFILSYALAALAVLCIGGASLFLFFFKGGKVKNEQRIRTILKVSNFILIFVFIARYLLSSDPIQNTFALTGGVFQDNKIANGFFFVLLLFYFPTILITMLRPFFDIKALRVLNKFVSLPAAVLNLIFLFAFVQGFNDFSNLVFINWTVLVLFALEVGVMLSTSLTAFLLDFKTDNKTNTSKNDIIFIILLGLLALVFAAPSYSLQYLFGSLVTPKLVLDFALMHRVFIYGVIFIAISTYLFHWHRSDVERTVVMLVLSLACLITFSVKYKLANMFVFTPDFQINFTLLPLHLCHTAMYVVPICIIFKKHKFFRYLFYFTYFINVFGAFAAIVLPNYGSTIAADLFGTSLMVFWVNHFDAMMMPLLAVALGIFERPKFKYMMWSLLFFAIYYFFILFINVWFANYEPSVDYFFINSSFIPEKFGKTVELAVMVPWSFTVGELQFTFYPIYQSLFFVVYIVVAFLMWYIYEIGFKIADGFHDIHARNVIIRKEKSEHLLIKKKINGGQNMEEEHRAELKFENFSKRYGSSEVFSAHEVNFEVYGGEIFGFLGPNGSGKSTCIKTAIGIQPITSGKISVCGYDVKNEPVQAKKMIGYVPDHYALYEKLTGREYINYIADLYGVNQKDRDERIAKYIDLFELYQAFDNRMQTYSHGMKQKIAIIAALVHNPKVWILDEPLTGLDPNSIFQVKECMKDHAKQGNIVFFSSHIIDVVEKLCDRIAIIKKGKILVVSPVKDIEKETTLEAYYMNLVGDNKDDEE